VKKGADLTYLWAAWRNDCSLVTLDKGLLQYDGKICEVITPSVYLARL